MIPSFQQAPPSRGVVVEAMTHSEQRTAWWKEGLITLGTGVLYGGTSVLVGHPFDTIKTKMQVQTGFENRTMMTYFVKTVL